jgi:septum formation protein
MNKLVLASTSKYRRALLDRLGLSYVAIAPKVDEEAIAESIAATFAQNAAAGSASPSVATSASACDAIALQLAQDKAASVAGAATDAFIIGSDQLVDLDGERLGKPGTIEKAEAQLRKLSGKTHRLVTAVALRHPDGRVETALDVHVMKLRVLSDAEVRRYVQRERPIDCAGSYKIESLGISLVESMTSSDGSDFTAIVGLPLVALCNLLRAAGFEVP